MRISCPPLVYPCEFINFSESRTPLELIARRFILKNEGAHDKNLGKYVRNDTPEYAAMVDYIKKEVNVGVPEIQLHRESCLRDRTPQGDDMHALL